jgi:transposase-like protein
LHKLLAQIGGAMGQSLPLAYQDWANTKAAALGAGSANSGERLTGR